MYFKPYIYYVDTKMYQFLFLFNIVLYLIRYPLLNHFLKSCPFYSQTGDVSHSLKQLLKCFIVVVHCIRYTVSTGEAIAVRGACDAPFKI